MQCQVSPLGKQHSHSANEGNLHCSLHETSVKLLASVSKNALGAGLFLGGHDLAIKMFEPKKWVFAVEEASVAEWVGDHPRISRLLDAFRRDDRVPCLVYAFGGRSVDVVLKG